MAFSNPIIAGDTLIVPAIESENYESDVQGWRLGNNGEAHFIGGQVAMDSTVPGALADIRFHSLLYGANNAARIRGLRATGALTLDSHNPGNRSNINLKGAAAAESCQIDIGTGRLNIVAAAQIGLFTPNIIRTYQGSPVMCQHDSASVQNINNVTFTVVTGWTNDATYTHPWCSDSGATVAGAIDIFDDGIYDIDSTVTQGNNAVGRRITSIWVNGVEVRRVDVAPGGLSTVQVRRKMFLNAGDQVDIRVWQNSGGVLALAGAPGHQWMIDKVG